jgi:hypothetical protein
MSNSKKIDSAVLVVGLAWTAIFLFVEFFVRANHHFQIGNDDKVHMSPAMAWATVPGFMKLLSWLSILAMWVVLFLGMAGKFETKSGGNSKGIVALAASLLFFLITTLGWYSGKTDNNFVQISEQQKKAWVDSGDIKQTGENSYKDKTGVLKALFANKEVIK